MREHTDKIYEDKIFEFDRQINDKIKNIEELERTILERKESLKSVTDKLKESGDNYIE